MLKSHNCIESRPFWILCLLDLQFSARFLNITATHVKETNKKDPRVSFPLSTLSTSYHVKKKRLSKAAKWRFRCLSLSLSHPHTHTHTHNAFKTQMKSILKFAPPKKHYQQHQNKQKQHQYKKPQKISIYLLRHPPVAYPHVSMYPHIRRKI